MKIFLTGATGYVGSALTRRFLKDGHQVYGLARSRAKARELTDAGMRLVLGDLKEGVSYWRAAAMCDALIHAGFEYGPNAEEADDNAVGTLIDAATASRKPRLLLYTSGVWVLGPRREAPADEQTPVDPPEIVEWRPRHERTVLDADGGGLAASVIRPGCVYGGDGGLYGLMLQSLFDRRVITLVGEGANRWASVYLDDLVELYCLALAKRPRGGTFHATDGSEDMVVNTAAALIDAAGGGEIEKEPLSRARRRLGPVADALAMDQSVSSAKARRELGWTPMMGSAALNATALLSEWRERVLGMAVA